MRVGRWLLLASVVLAASGCSLMQKTPTEGTVTLPVFPGWFDNNIVYYIKTDAWPHQAAVDMKVNYAPRLRHSLPPRPKPPELDTVIERIYVFPNEEQVSVLPSSPKPIGPNSRNEPYSPIWVLHEVTWIVPEQYRELTSERAVLDAQSHGWVEVTPTEIVVNCAVVGDDRGNVLFDAKIH